MDSKLSLEETLNRNKINIKKAETSLRVLDYYTQNFFDSNTIVPSVQVGTASRKMYEDNKEVLSSTTLYDIPNQNQIAYPDFNLMGTASRTKRTDSK